MASSLRPTSRHKLIRRLRELGWTGPRSGKNHQMMEKGNRKLHVPNKHQSDIGVGLLKRILAQAGITREQWNGD